MHRDSTIQALAADKPLPEEEIAWLEDLITDYDCEEWDAETGRSIIARFRREAARATEST
jgi:hypothetical protein